MKDKKDKDRFIHSSAWRHIRAQVIAHENICYLCGQKVDKHLKTGPMRPSVDHVVSRDSGGDLSSMSNLHLVHAICNSKKTNLTLEEYRYREAMKASSSRDWDNV